MTNDTTTTINFFSFSTAAAVREKLETLGVEGPAADLIIKMGAPARHEARVQKAIEAAKAVSKLQVGNDNAFGRGCHAAQVIAVLLADMVGVGGHAGLTGEATVRVPAFAALGKGRKQASDGAAYSAAIKDALTRTMSEVGAHGVIVGVDFETFEPFVGLTDLQYGPEDEGTRLGWSGFIEAGVPEAWVRSIAGRAIMALSQGQGRFDVDGVTVYIEQELAKWAKAFNLVADAR